MKKYARIAAFAARDALAYLPAFLAQARQGQARSRALHHGRNRVEACWTPGSGAFDLFGDFAREGPQALAFAAATVLKYGLPLVFAILAVFIAGLMIGRTPEYLGKKIEAFEIKMASLVILVPAAAVLVGTALALPQAPASRAFTMALMLLPSAWPASCLVAAPITLPISPGPAAPVSVMVKRSRRNTGASQALATQPFAPLRQRLHVAFQMADLLLLEQQPAVGLLEPAARLVQLLLRGAVRAFGLRQALVLGGEVALVQCPYRGQLLLQRQHQVLGQVADAAARVAMRRASHLPAGDPQPAAGRGRHHQRDAGLAVDLEVDGRQHAGVAHTCGDHRACRQVGWAGHDIAVLYVIF